LQLISISLGRYTEIDLKFTILDGLSPEQVIKQLPKPYMERAQVLPLRGNRYHLLLFGAAKDEVVSSGVVKRGLERLPPNEAELVAAGPGFTAEALELLRARDATIYALSDFHWTDAGFQSIRQATRLPREEP
jgi:hypothetical protein